MKYSTTVAILTGFVAAQRASSVFGNPSQSFVLNPTLPSTSVGDLEPITTETVTGPVQTGQACAVIAEVVSSSSLRSPSVDAELAYACLKSVPIYPRDAASTIDAIQQMVQFQSTLAYLKEPPTGWPNGPVDIMAGLDKIKSLVNTGGYDNEYDFENDIAALLVKAHDGHLSFNGMAYAGAFRWRRNSRLAMVSASRNGADLPKVWALMDYNTTNPSFTPSPIARIDGKDIGQFLQDEANLISYHDPDVRYNAMFFMQPAGNWGFYVNPRFYPGPMSNVTFENGTSQQYKNSAIVLDPEAWEYITDPESFYETYVTPSTSSERVKKRDPHSLPFQLENPRDHEIGGAFSSQQGSVPAFYPRPSVAHSDGTVSLAGFFLTTSAGQIGVLVVQTFNTDDSSSAVEFQSVVQQYIAQAKARGVAKHIIDVRSNGGGKVLLGYDMYLQFFPSQKPQTQSRFRGHRASELFGRSISSYTQVTSRNAELFTSPFSNDAFLSKDLQNFPDWASMYPPETFQGDNFTALLKYNLSDPLTTSNAQVGLGITMTGYGRRNNFTEDPFRAADLVILSDGICSSTCSIFLELMVQQSHVRTLAVGGRPQLGPMTPVGGTKGTLVLPSTFLQSLSGYILQNFASSRSEARDWATYVPNLFAISVADASINFQDNIRAGMESAGIPTQFLNDTSSCRIWYEADMYFNVSRLWEKTAKVAFGGKDSTLDPGACIRGSATTQDQQTGRGPGNGTTQGGGKKSMASGRQSSWLGVLVCAAILSLGYLKV